MNGEYERPIALQDEPINHNHGGDMSVTDPVIAMTSLGDNNKGTIGAGDLRVEEREAVIADIGSPEYRVQLFPMFVCVDGGVPDGGRGCPEGFAPGQIAGSEAISGAAADMQGQNPAPLSELIARNTSETIKAGYTVVVHGDVHVQKRGCGANAKLREVLRSNAQNIDIIAPTVWTLAGLLGIDQYLTKDDIVSSIVTGKENADNDDLWDVDAEGSVDVAVANGAQYEEVGRPHNEKGIKLEIDEDVAHDEERFKADHVVDGALTLETFAATLGAYKKMVFEKVLSTGGTEVDAAIKVARALAFNVGVCKELTTAETDTEAVKDGNPGAALTVIITGTSR